MKNPTTNQTITTEQTIYKTYTKTIKQFNKYSTGKLLEECLVEVDNVLFLQIINKVDIRSNCDSNQYEIIVLDKNKHYVNNFNVSVA